MIAASITACSSTKGKANDGIIGTWNCDKGGDYYGYDPLEFFEDGSFIAGAAHSGFHATGEYTIKKGKIIFTYSKPIAKEYDLWRSEINFSLQNDNTTLIITPSEGTETNLSHNYSVTYKKE